MLQSRGWQEGRTAPVRYLETTAAKMATVYRLTDFRRRRDVVSFTRQELNLLLSVYSRRVISGVWKAYAIDHEHGMAQFSIFANAHAQPLFTVVKFTAPSKRTRKYVVLKGPNKVAESDMLAQALAYFGRDLKVVSS